MIAKPLFLYGPPGVGKTTLGQLMSSHLDVGFIDLDSLIETRTGRPINEIFAKEGEVGFRNVEQRVLMEVLRDCPEVVSLGGGTLLDSESRARVERAGKVICLMGSFTTLSERIGQSPSGRPLLDRDPLGRLCELYDRRKSHYESFKSVITVNERTCDELLWDIQAMLGHFHLTGMGKNYDLLVGQDNLKVLDEKISQVGLQPPYFLVMDDRVANHHGGHILEVFSRMGDPVSIFRFPEGEHSKSLSTVQELWRRMISHGMGRDSTCIAFGGGVAGDLTGFTAATFMRGVPWVNLPTSLLAMVDASLGGKTGINLPEGKNLVGAFHAPRLVLADLRLLNSLSEREFRSGMAEVVKHGIVGDPILFNLCRKGLDSIKQNLTEIVPRAIAVKARIVVEDPYEVGVRESLNFGHTIGHAVEKSSEFRLNHGEAVAVGMAVETRLAEHLGIAQQGLYEQVVAVLNEIGLTVALPNDIAVDSILVALQQDKKKKQGEVRFSLPERIGKVKVGVNVPNLDLLIKERMQ